MEFSDYPKTSITISQYLANYVCLIYNLFKFPQLRFGEVNKHISNTNVFEHAGKMYSIAENHKPQEIDPNKPVF